VAVIDRIFGGLSARALAVGAALLAVLLLLPLVADRYVVSVLVLVFASAYLGQAWNIMMGFAGQLSLGHALYVGLAAYAAAALYVHFGIGPWAGLFVGMALAAAMAAVIGFLGFRFGIEGVHFALLTIAFCEFTRIGFDHIGWTGGAAGFFIPVAHDRFDPLNLRGGPTMWYYMMLALMLGGLALCRALMRARIGYYWLAIREDPEAARALGIDIFRYKLIAVVLSAAMTSLGGVFIAFYYNNIWPVDAFSITRSIDIILAPIVGGLGTLLGPIVGAFILTPIGEALIALLERLGLAVPGAKQIFYGLVLLTIIWFLPGGIWPALARRLKLGDDRG
jgi:branched-chain amino acid transport system permease protein